MLDKIINWLSGTLLPSIKGVFTEIWRVTADFGKNIWVMFTTFCGMVYWVFDTLKGVVISLIQSLDAIFLPGGNLGMPGSLSYYASVCNTFFPLSEGCGMLVAYFTLMVALTTYKLVKGAPVVIPV